MDCWKENEGYVCGNNTDNKNFIIKKQLRCGDNLKTHCLYYW